MVNAILTSAMADLQRARKQLEDAKTLIQVQKDAGQSTGAAEAEIADLEARIKQFEDAINKNMRK